jgi:hypothetical protein
MGSGVTNNVARSIHMLRNNTSHVGLKRQGLVRRIYWPSLTVRLASYEWNANDGSALAGECDEYQKNEVPHCL